MTHISKFSVNLCCLLNIGLLVHARLARQVSALVPLDALLWIFRIAFSEICEDPSSEECQLWARPWKRDISHARQRGWLVRPPTTQVRNHPQGLPYSHTLGFGVIFGWTLALHGVIRGRRPPAWRIDRCPFALHSWWLGLDQLFFELKSSPDFFSMLFSVWMMKMKTMMSSI